jgi:hypothetical protein
MPAVGLGLGDGFCATTRAAIVGLLLGPTLGAALGGICATSCACIEGAALGKPLALGLGGVCRLGSAADAAPAWGRIPTASAPASAAIPMAAVFMR